MKKINISWNDNLVLFKALKLIFQCDKNAFVKKVFYVTIMSILPLLNLYVLKYVIDGITDAVAMDSGDAMMQIVRLATVFGLIFLTTRIVGVLNTVNNDILTQKLIDYINNLIQTQSGRLDMAYYDNPDYHDTMHRAQQEAAYRPVRILDNFVSVFGAILSLSFVLIMLISTSWKVILVMILAVLPSFFVKLYKSRKIYAFRRETTQQMRRSHYYGQLLSNRAFAQEIRSFALHEHFRKLFVEVRRGLVSSLFRISKRLALYDGLTSVIETGALIVTLLILIRPALTGAITIGSFVMVFEAYRRGQGYMGELVSGISGLYEHKLFIGNLYEFLALEPKIVSPENPKPFPQSVSSVEFCNVVFAYPDMKVPALNHFNFTARLGEIAHLQGENGFGKTTALKLLLRLYDPQEGSVRINGIDIREFHLDDLRHGVSAIFQDHVRFFFTAKETIEFGDVNHPNDSARLENAVRLSESRPIIEKLTKGYDTLLGRMFDDGEELSMGQWQRLALARQLYSNAPVLVFDEPTAWMDASARERFMHNLEELKKDHVVILIAHI